MDSFMFVPLALGLLVPVFLAVVIGIIVVAGRARPNPTLGPRVASPGSRPTSGSWNVQILSDSLIGRMGGAAGDTSGTFTVHEGTLHFVPSGAAAPTWSLPCAGMTARANTAFSTAGVELWWPEGHLRCNVSREHINRYSRNTIKTMREPRYYREFVDVLVANGATQA